LAPKGSLQKSQEDESFSKRFKAVQWGLSGAVEMKVMPSFADPANLEGMPQADAIEGADALSFLQAIYRSANVPLSVRMRAAIEALPFESPKLSATAIIQGDSFAERLERAIARSTWSILRQREQEIATMSEHETKFEIWNKVYNEHERRVSFYVQVAAKYPPDHALVKEAKAKLDEALAEYKRVLSEL
jgi:hypothetical protein